MKIVTDRSLVQMFNDDCLNVMKTLPDKSIDLLLTDPPYGINIIRGGGRGIHGWRDFRSQGEWDKRRPTKAEFDEMFRVSKRQVIWGGNYFTDYLPVSKQWLVWDKGQRNFSLADGELAWSSQNKSLRIFTFHRSKMRSQGGLHPTQKPLELMEWCIGQFKNVTSILDPYMGSGTTGVVCARLGIPFIGIEGDPCIFAAARKRILAVKQPENSQEL